jgi:hypothetical protein
MIIEHKLSKKRLDKETKAIANKMMRIIEDIAKHKNIPIEAIVSETGIKEDMFLDSKLPTLTQFLKICFCLGIKPHELIGNVYTSHEVVLK